MFVFVVKENNEFRENYNLAINNDMTVYFVHDER